jgi:hypothetical protein
MLWCRGLDGGRRRARAPADVLPVRPADVRSGQARTTMGPGDVGRATGTRMPDVPGGPAGLGRAARPVRVLWSYAAFCDARTGRVPRVRPRPRRAGQARVDGRLAQRESASLTRKRSGVRVPQRPREARANAAIHSWRVIPSDDHLRDRQRTRPFRPPDTLPITPRPGVSGAVRPGWR